MRARIFLLVLLLCVSHAHAYQFVFKNGKSIQGSILYEDGSLYRIVDTTGIEMRIRKTELNLPATQAANVVTEVPVVEPVVQPQTETTQPARRPARVYSNVDVGGASHLASAPADPHSETAWRTHISKLERDFARLQAQCRGAGTGPDLSKVRRTDSYRVNGKTVHITGYWADPANIESAKKICRRAIQTEKALNDARLQFSEFQTEQQSSQNR